jgi:hypothetical protein
MYYLNDLNVEHHAKKTFAPYAHFGIDFESFLQSLPSNHLKGLTLD